MRSCAYSAWLYESMVMVAMLPDVSVKSRSRSNSYPALKKLDVPNAASSRACTMSVRPS